MRRPVSHAALMMLLEAPTTFLSIPTLFLSKGRTMSDSLPVCTTVVLTMLRLLSRSAYVTAAELARRLAAEGVSVQLRSLQRTLKIMSETPVYGVERNADHKPYGYRLAAPATLASAKLSPRDALLMRLTDESLGAALLLRLDEEVGEEAQEVMNERFERLKDREARRRVAVIPDLPLLTPPLLVPEVLDAVATALFRNAKLVFSYRDGELRYKSFIDADHITPSVDVIGNAVHRISAMYRRYAPGILDIILAGGTAKAAMAKCGEKSPEDELRAMLAEDMGYEASGGSLDELLSRMASELGISEEEESEFDSADEVTEEIHVNPFESKGTDEEGEE